MQTHIYKILLRSEWNAFQKEGQFKGAPIDKKDGYIHLSTAMQTSETANKHFQGANDLVLAEVQVDKLGAALRYDTSRGGDLFPHLYAALGMDAITRHWDWQPGPDGAYGLPEDI